VFPATWAHRVGFGVTFTHRRSTTSLENIDLVGELHGGGQGEKLLRESLQI